MKHDDMGGYDPIEQTSSCPSSSTCSSSEELEIADSEGTRLMEKAMFELSDRYRFRERISCSEYTIVYQALDMETYDSVAIKLDFHPQPWAQPSEYPSEYITLSQLGDARHCQRILHFSLLMESRVAVLISPFYTGDRFPTKEQKGDIRLFMRQLLQFLADAHERGVIHRDIKLSNSIWNQKSRRLTVIDFDLATISRPDGHTTYAGTEGFTSPEMRLIRANKGKQVYSDFSYDEKTDIYSAGVVFACLLMSISEIDMNARCLKRIVKKIENFKRPSICHRLLLLLLRHDHTKRISAEEALRHKYFTANS